MIAAENNTVGNADSNMPLCDGSDAAVFEVGTAGRLETALTTVDTSHQPILAALLHEALVPATGHDMMAVE